MVQYHFSIIYTLVLFIVLINIVNCLLFLYLQFSFLAILLCAFVILLLFTYYYLGLIRFYFSFSILSHICSSTINLFQLVVKAKFQFSFLKV